MMPSKLTKAIVLFMLILPFHSTFSAKYYVTPSGIGTGSSWADALGDIQTAIDAASSGDEVWVKTGTYKPHTSDRNVSFALKSGVKIYGGFQGTETSIEDRPLTDIDGNGEVEDWEFEYATILSGEIQGDGIESNNSQHVVYLASGLDASTLINGFTVIDGYSDLVAVTSQGNVVCGAGILALSGKVNKCWIKDSKTITNGTCYAAGIMATDAQVLNSKVQNCHSISTSNKGVGGGMYTYNSIVDACKIISCSSTSNSESRTDGGGIYLHNSTMINCEVYDNEAIAGTNGEGGGVYSFAGIISNTVISNCEASMKGGGLYIAGGGYITNCVVANCKVSETDAIGGGVYMDGPSTVYNSVFWGNETSETAAQFRLDDSGTANNCAVQNQETTGTNNINISADNTGSADGVLYASFQSPTNFVGVTAGDATKETSLLAVDWNIKETSSLIEKGDNVAFNEPHAKVGYDLNGDGDTFDNIDNFTDPSGENRLFNKYIDIGAYESVFIDLILPTVSTLEYGSTLSEVIFTGGSAKDNRNDTDIEGAYSFTSPSFMPEYSHAPQKFRVAFTAVDNTTYPVHYDSVYVTVTAKELTLSNLIADNKIYDGTTDVTFSGSATLNGIVSGDDVTLTAGAITATFNDKNVGDDKPVSFQGYDLGGVDEGNYILSLVATEANITPKPISISVLDAQDKVYDGTNVAAYNNTPLPAGAIATDDLSIDISESTSLFDTKNVGMDKTVSYAGFKLAGVDKDNYTLSQPLSSLATISKLSISITGVSSANKQYDGLTNAVITGTANATGILAGDDAILNVSSAEAHFDTENVGNDKPIVFSGYILTGVDAFNYEFTQPTSTIGDITKKELTISGLTITAKDYDGTTNASIVGTPSLNGVISGEDVNLSTTTPSASFEDANAAIGKAVTISGYSITGAGVSNYNLTNPSLTGDINPVDIALSANSATKIYDEADPTFTYTITSGSLIGTDDFTGAIGRTTGEDVGNYDITQGTLALSSNYTIIFTGSNFEITQAANIINFTINSPVEYESGKQITLSATASSGETVLFQSSDNKIASISGDVLTIADKGLGSITITATESLNQNYVAATPILVTLDIIPRVEAIRKGDNMVLIDNSDELFASYQWYQAGNAIAGATKQYYYSSSAIAGEYYCVVTTSKGEDYTSNTISTITGKAMSVYPSPARVGSNFSIDLTGFEDASLHNEKVDIYSATGDLIKQISNPSETNKISINKPGIYIIKTTGNSRLAKKVIVK
ncbi:YDG domain-containing protein [Labilibacter marinus]|uniref:YDG domain-containing protein n=1 Tax=Labilibacter marinus TaxID=1477105 RepID=UPI0009FB49E7|nr:YDG domain-containing protein [Labilibacter marinus]